MNQDRYLINSVLRAARVLECFSRERPALTNAQLARELGLSKSTLTRLLYSLERAGFVDRSQRTGEYRLTAKLYRLGSIYIGNLNLLSEAKPVLRDLAQLTGETVHLGILDQDQVLYVDKIDGSHSIGMRSRLGTRAPAYCTAMGKVLLAGLEERELADYLGRAELTPRTANTITDPEELTRHLRLVRRLGYGLDEVEHEDGVKCVAGPVRDASGRMAGAISVSAPAFRLSLEKEEVVIKAVAAAARELSQRLGYVEEEASVQRAAAR